MQFICPGITVIESKRVVITTTRNVSPYFKFTRCFSRDIQILYIRTRGSLPLDTTLCSCLKHSYAANALTRFHKNGAIGKPGKNQFAHATCQVAVTYWYFSRTGRTWSNIGKLSNASAISINPGRIQPFDVHPTLSPQTLWKKR